MANLFSFIILSGLTLLPSSGNAAVQENKSEAFKNSSAPVKVWIEQPADPLLADTQFSLKIMVGNDTEPVSGLFGLSFELHYSDSRYLEFIEPVEATAGPFLEPDTYTFTRHEPENQVFYLAVSRKRGAGSQNGNGLVMQLLAKLSKDAPPDWGVCFEIVNVSANDHTGTAIPLQAGDPMCLTVADITIDVIPNPFTPNEDGSNDQVEFKRDGGIPGNWLISIMDRSGRVVKRLTNGERFWDGRNEQRHPMLPGTYLYTIYDGKQTIKRGLLWLIL